MIFIVEHFLLCLAIILYTNDDYLLISHSCLVAGAKAVTEPLLIVCLRLSLSGVDQAFSVWYHCPIQNTDYYFRRIFTRAASLERRCKDEQKSIPRNSDNTQHEGMELH